MVLIFGFGQGQGQDLGAVAPLTCPTCHNDVLMHHVRSEKKFQLYFVPVATYGTSEYLLCPICTRGLQVADAQRSTVAGMRSATDAHRRGRVPEDLYRIEVQQFWARMGLAPAPAPAGRPPGPAPLAPAPAGRPALPVPAAPRPLAPSPAAPPSTIADRLAGLAELHRTGVLTDAEFSAAKDRLLRS